ncbi:hypothetical protein ACP70R_010909 [Stipagrostis hirtigluma subsp. patula]
MRSKRGSGKRRGSNRRNNDVSRISEAKDIFNVSVRKKRGRRPAAHSKNLRGKEVDKAVDSDDAVDSYTDEDQVGISQSADIEECVDGGTGDLDLSKKAQLGTSSDGQSSASEEQDHSTNSKDMPQKACSQGTEQFPECQAVTGKSFGAEEETNATRRLQDALNLKQEGVDSESTGQKALANENSSNVQAAVMKKAIDEERSSREIKDDQVPDVQAKATSSDDKSSEEVEDVKVCDICGDVGEEEKLAVCSRCNDGAEHTYCMRIMMEEVPESEWLCEDCQTEVESEKENKLAKCKDLDTAIEGNDAVNSRMEEDAAVTPSVRETIPEPSGLCMVADSRKRMPTSRESSFKLDADKGKHHQVATSSGLCMGADSRKRMPPSRESSFKLDADKGKHHQVDTSLASNSLKNQASQPHGQLSKSTSFNSSKVPKVKQLPNEIPQKPKNSKEPWSSIIKKEGAISMTTKSATFKKPKPCEPANKANPSILSPTEEPRIMNPSVSQNVKNDRGTSILGCPSATATIVGTVPSKDDVTAHHLGTTNNSVESNNLSIAHGQGGKNSLGNSELNKPLLAKMPGSAMLPSTERSFVLGSGAQRKVIQNSDPSQRDNKIKAPPSSRPAISSSNRTVAAEKTASRSADQSEEIPKCGIYKTPIYGPKDALPAPFSHVKKPGPLFVRTDEQHMRYSSSTPGSATSIDCSKLNFRDDHPNQSAIIGRTVDNGCTVPSDRRDKSSKGFSTGDEAVGSTVPELDYIWQGGFELRRTGRLPELCDGFQAHLSCSASHLVLEVAKKFPSNVQLEELPRQTSWPTQFQESGPTYDNVGLFFFARDAQSYENYYSKLVENMLKNDLMLRGSVDTVELLIFPSNILSKNFQRWNMFYFLWGVFRVSRKNCVKLPPDVPTSRCKSNLSEGSQAMDQSTSGHSLSKDKNNVSEPAPNLEANPQGCLNGVNSWNQPVSQRPSDDHHDSVTSRCSTKNTGSINITGSIDQSTTTTERKDQKLDYLGHKDKMSVTFDGNVSERDFDVNKVPVSLIHEEDDLMDIDHEGTTEVDKGALHPFPHASGGACKRNFDMAGEVDGAQANKKIKSDNTVSANSDLSENVKDRRLSSKVHPMAASSVDDGTDHKAMAGSSNSDGKCIFPLDLNAVNDEVSGNTVNVPSSQLP